MDMNVALEPPFVAEEVELPVDHHALVRILKDSGRCKPEHLDAKAARAELVLKYIRHVADYGRSLDAPNPPQTQKLLVYLDGCTSCTEGVADWMANSYIAQAPDWIDFDEYECAERHLRRLASAEQLHGWVRTAGVTK